MVNRLSIPAMAMLKLHTASYFIEHYEKIIKTLQLPFHKVESIDSLNKLLVDYQFAYLQPMHIYTDPLIGSLIEPLSLAEVTVQINPSLLIRGFGFIMFKLDGFNWIPVAKFEVVITPTVQPIKVDI